MHPDIARWRVAHVRRQSPAAGVLADLRQRHHDVTQRALQLAAAARPRPEELGGQARSRARHMAATCASAMRLQLPTRGTRAGAGRARPGPWRLVAQPARR